MESIRIQDEIYKKYVIKKGGLTIEHIFNFLLYYTLNIDLTYHHCEQGFIYYIEFISQMIINGDSTLLALSSKDAVLFVLKKTIFDISKEYRELNPLSENDNKKLNLVKNFTSTYKNILFLYIDGLKFDSEKVIKENETKSIKNIVINMLYNEIIENNNTNPIDVINYFIDFIRNKEELSICNKLNVIEQFIKKYNKQFITMDKLQNKLQYEMVDNVLNDANYNYSNILKLFALLFN
jgi:hypothetical protein